MSEGKPWLDCPQERAETVLKRCFGQQRYSAMREEYKANPPLKPTHTWIKWLMHLAMKDGGQRRLFG